MFFFFFFVKITTSYSQINSCPCTGVLVCVIDVAVFYYHLLTIVHSLGFYMIAFILLPVLLCGCWACQLDRLISQPVITSAGVGAWPVNADFYLRYITEFHFLSK